LGDNDLEESSGQRIFSEQEYFLSETKKDLGFFGIESADRLSGIVENLNQTFDGKELYKSVEEKAANLLYMVIKDHPFIDGNKRTGSLLFVHYLDQNDILYRETGERRACECDYWSYFLAYLSHQGGFVMMHVI
jgi:prophage maintenance system killer protein